MNGLRLLGVQLIVWLQNLPFLGPTVHSVLLAVTKLGDPALSFTVYFPLFYPFLPDVMVDTAALSAVCEFLNIILKYLILDDRPYWWVYTSGAVQQGSVVRLKQFKWTCETGPGNPSGHAMVASSVWFFFLKRILGCESSFRSRLLWTAYACYMTALCTTRLYIGAHFPDQVVLGWLAGVLLAYAALKWTRHRRSVFVLPFVLLLLTVSALAVYKYLLATGHDPDWSIPLAKYCKKAQWIHMSTTPLASYYRDGGSLLALAVLDHVRTIRQRHQHFTTLYYAALTLVHVIDVLLVGLLPYAAVRLQKVRRKC